MLTSLEKWLANPTIKIVQESSGELEHLQAENEDLRKKVKHLESLYAEECFINMRLVDILSSNGIKWR